MTAAATAYALVVAVADYQHVGALLATQDAAAVRAVLVSPDLCAYPAANVTVLEEGAATRAAILDALAAICARADARSRVFVYLSGHGGCGPDGVAYFLPVDARTGDLAGTAIATRALADALDGCAAREVTIVLDCCRAGGVLAAGKAPPGLTAFPPSLRRDLEAPARVILAASSEAGAAYVADDAPYGSFTGYLLAGLRGEASADGGDVTVFALFDYVQQQVVRASRRAQQPMFIGAIDRNYPLTRYPRPVPPRVVFLHDVFVSYDRRDAAMREWVRAVLVPELQQAALTIWDHDDLGGNAITDEAIVASRYTIALLTPSYLEDALRELTTTMAILQAVETRTPRFIPVLREPCALPLYIRGRVGIDLTPRRAMEFRYELDRLIARLKKAPHER